LKEKRNVPKVVGKKQTHEYCKEQLLKKIKNNPSLKLTVGQILILFSDYTANQLKHFRSASYKGNDAPPVDLRFGRPRYQYDQFLGWHKNTAAKTAKTAKAS
jgi:hypothetical protein